MATEQINQELEDAAEYYYPTDNGQWAHPAYKDAFKKGVNWKSEQLSTHAIEFANWLLGEAYREWNKRASLPLEEAHKQLYELWQQSKNK